MLKSLGNFEEEKGRGRNYEKAQTSYGGEEETG